MTETHPSTVDPHHAEQGRRPSVLIFDVNETLSDMTTLADRFADVGVPAHLRTSWFAGVLRDGFALMSLGVNKEFAAIAEESLRVLFGTRTIDRDPGDAARHVMEGFAGLPVHPDVPEGVRALADAGFRLVTLSNGSTSVAEGLLERAGIRENFEAVLSVEDAPLWKPAAEAYGYALRRCAVESADAMLVAVHPWDIEGAARAGLRTAWINRENAPYPAYFTSPDLDVASVTALSAAVSD